MISRFHQSFPKSVLPSNRTTVSISDLYEAQFHNKGNDEKLRNNAMVLRIVHIIAPSNFERIIWCSLTGKVSVRYPSLFHKHYFFKTTNNQKRVLKLQVPQGDLENQHCKKPKKVLIILPASLVEDCKRSKKFLPFAKCLSQSPILIDRKKF